MGTFTRIAAAFALLTGSAAGAQDSPGFLDVKGTQIVDGQGRPVILRGMGLGGWMLQEGYMLKLGEVGPQHAIHRKLAELVGQEAVDAFQRAWLDNHMTKADLDAYARWGFNSVRLPMHWNLFLDPSAPAGTTRFNEDGFRRLDALLQWAAANRMWVMLDLHAAPGGQGTDLPISDRDPTKPSLWESAENQRLTVELWREIARRYADNPWVGAYDLVNEPNWDFDGQGGHGCEDKKNGPIEALYKRITSAIRTHDKRHIIVIEGNCWGNNYAGITPDWDPKLVLSFHKYWNRNTDAALAGILKLRKETGRPIWLGESGENSNGWYRDAIRLAEGHGIGWAWWPHKKMGFNQPLEIRPNPGWDEIVAWMTGKGPRPDPAAARTAMMRVATHDIAFPNLIQHRDVVDAMIRQPHDDTTLPFADHRLGPAGVAIAAVDYDLGAPGIAYRDTVEGNYHVDTGGERTPWNDGTTYRNDGVDIAREADGAPFVTAFERGEWLHYTVAADGAGVRPGRLVIAAESPATLWVSLNGGARLAFAVPAAQGWSDVPLPPLAFQDGTNRLVVGVAAGRVRLQSIRLGR
ncbi:cellulase family glycosylhydrolase [Sphingomonas sabuli]|uniref:Cellulase family glycosylhydrolase n=2 Tax=Sphingomonas sabuli TaxID=2764186 RepID=A0A7G9L661_9SPHN|nr:cellulase family glycosylhydrolase [Sphingomonas sabuli]